MRDIKTFARAFLIVLGAVSLSWVGFAVPPFGMAATKNEVTARLLADDRFKPGALRESLAVFTGRAKWFPEYSKITRAEALMKIRIAEESIRSIDLQEAGTEKVHAKASILSSLASNPGDAYLWLALYSTQLLSEGFDPEAISYLDTSYFLGPMEGWIAIRRNRLALAAFPMLDESLQAKVVSEFCALVSSEFIDAAVFNFVGVGWQQRNRLLQGISQIHILPRTLFAKRLANEAVSISIPGVSIDERFWR
ncbi:hypothetical protein [Bradyrhizobium sp. CW1]|uniref:hypothetical protein n=1 Tax=Bradyrhizobium sp. CW1 TaxID=2782686 RepID=UPI0020000B7A|nr:hypothetical protein [Bradyrhizobium sp. CW1]UPJ26028.1 hypothetical protein IVB54_29980 [Bradyrhizobium sp. CW1]